ncbi:hypothetical protein [Streptomyces zingiberis]|uniref:hypothetical protein n=1 Tax=Streptomyces zingiberis TaxID=2053010 RepID=UPI0019D21172|nr:hypothetical protein [Streptomyces zingiberis]
MPRWAAAVAVFACLAAGTGSGLAATDRTHLPGLATEHDGRWDYGPLEPPARPTGAPRPSAGDPAGTHHGDPRGLLLPPPAGAVPEKGLTGADGRLPVADFVAEYEEEHRAAVREQLTENACRHITSRGWTMPDGTRTRIHLLRFGSAGHAFLTHELAFGSAGTMAHADLAGAGASDLVPDWPLTVGSDAQGRLFAYDEREPYGERRVRHAYIVAGDTVALIVQSVPASGPDGEVPFRQTVVLQYQLLSWAAS